MISGLRYKAQCEIQLVQRVGLEKLSQEEGTDYRRALESREREATAARTAV